MCDLLHQLVSVNRLLTEIKCNFELARMTNLLSVANELLVTAVDRAVHSNATLIIPAKFSEAPPQGKFEEAVLKALADPDFDLETRNYFNPFGVGAPGL